jgi:hypothetical protein
MKVTYHHSPEGGFHAVVKGLRKMADGQPEPIFAIRFTDENAVHAIRSYIQEVQSDLTARPETVARLNNALEKAVIIQASGQCRRPDCDVTSDFIEKKTKANKDGTTSTSANVNKPGKTGKKGKKPGKVKA